MIPTIGITTTLKTIDYYDYPVPCTILPEFYIHAIIHAGGLPVLLPPVSTSLVDLYLERVQGLIFSGGMDIDPKYFNQQKHEKTITENPVRDSFELKLMQSALERDLPILAICRGMQVLNVALGGNLCQDITDLKGAAISHWQDRSDDTEPVHTVAFTSGMIKDCFLRDEIPVNSFHHQAVDKIGNGLRVTGNSPDGIVEVLESSEHAFVLGVQWHPELMYISRPEQLAIFKLLVQKSTN